MANNLSGIITETVADRFININNISAYIYNNNYIAVYNSIGESICQLVFDADIEVTISRERPFANGFQYELLSFSYDELSDIDIFIGSILLRRYYDT